MACRTYVVKTTDEKGRVRWELKCFGDCSDLPCDSRWWTGSGRVPEGLGDNAFRTCYCDDEFDAGMPDCDDPGPDLANNLKTCRIGLLFKRGKDGVPVAEAHDAACLGRCTGVGKCKIVEVGSTSFDGIKIEVLRCACKR